MFLTKTRIAILTIILALIYFSVIFTLPVEIDEVRRDDTVLFSIKVAFIAVSAAITTSLILMFIFKRSFFTGQIYTFKKYRHYISLRVKRDFIARYRKSILGVLWSILNPLLTMLVISIVFSYLFRFNRGIEPSFPVYVISGQIIFNFFSESTQLAMGSIIENESVIKKIYVPKYAFPLSKMISSLVNLGFSFIAFLLVFIFTGAQFSPTMLLIPLPMIYLFVFALGVAMLMSSLVVFFRDLQYLYSVLLTLWMFLTPIMYPVEGVIPEWLQPYYGLNPMYQFVTYFRSVALWNTVPGLWDNMVCIAFALASLCLGTYVFMRRQNRYILHL